MKIITFGFNSRISGWLRAAVAIAIGTVMVAHPADSLVLVVKIAAAFLVASGIASLMFGILNRDRNALGIMIVNSVVDILLGVLIFAFPDSVAKIMVIILGVALVALGLFQIVVLGSAFGTLFMGFWSFLLPVLCTAGGALLLLNPFGSAKTLTLVAGICVLVYGVSELLATIQMNRAIKVMRPSGADGIPTQEELLGAKDAEDTPDEQ